MSSEKLQPCLQRRVFGEWVEDLWSWPGRYTLQEPPNSWKTEQSLSWFSHSPCVFEPITFEWHHWIFRAAAGRGFDPRLTWVASAARVFSVSLTKVRPAPEIATFSSWLFLCQGGFYEKIDKTNILWAVFPLNNPHSGWWTAFKTEKKIFNSFRVVPAHQLSSCDVGSGPGVRAYGSAQVPFSLPGRKWQIQ